MLSRALFALAATISSFANAQSEPACISHSQANPIWTQYPGNITGTVNSTLAILPIPYSLARSIIPSEYPILKSAYQKLLPNLADDMYPALLQAVRDHDVRFGEYQLADFSRASIEFPFVDLLKDGYTSFRWAQIILITSSNEMAINGAEEYGTTVYPSSFEPDCNAYESSPKDPSETFYNAKSVAGEKQAFIDTLFKTSSPGYSSVRDFPMEFFVNSTNQPSFANGSVCDQYIRLFNTSLSAGANAAVPVTGTVKAKLDHFGNEMVWTDAIGLRIDTAFIENHLVSCQGLQGYNGVEDQIVPTTWTSESTNTSFLPSFSLQAVFSNYIVSPIRSVVS